MTLRRNTTPFRFWSNKFYLASTSPRWFKWSRSPRPGRTLQSAMSTNNAVPHGIVHSVPFIRIQGGANAIIIDPQVGDIGIAIFADRDTTGVEANKAQANPGSGRRFDMADAMYIGGLLNGVPSQYVQFNTSGITIVSPTQVELQAPEVQIVAPVVVINASTSFSVTSPAINLTGNVATTGLLTNNTVDVGSPHTHGGVTTGTGRTGFPA
jgi:hypothetical protein